MTETQRRKAVEKTAPFEALPLGEKPAAKGVLKIVNSTDANDPKVYVIGANSSL
jgi:hypothetical protein